MPSSTKVVSASRGVETEGRSEGPQTKLAAVREQLQANPNVVVIGELSTYYELHGLTDRAGLESVDIIVAPVKPLFEAAQLNAFMSGLFTDDVQWPGTGETRAYDDGKGLRLGHITLEEQIASIRRTTSTVIESKDSETIQRAGLVVGESRVEEQGTLMRGIHVRVYPDQSTATDVGQYELDLANGRVKRDSKLAERGYHLEKSYLRRIRGQHSSNRVVRRIFRGSR